MTAKEFLENYENRFPKLKVEVSTEENRNSFYSSAQGAQITLDVMIEFAKYHVENALNAAANNALTKTEQIYNGGLDPNKISMYDDIEVIDQESILNAYPLSQIK